MEFYKTDGSGLVFVEFKEENFTNEAAGVEKLVECFSCHLTVSTSFGKILVHEIDEIKFHLLDCIMDKVHESALTLLVLS